MGSSRSSRVRFKYLAAVGFAIAFAACGAADDPDRRPALPSGTAEIAELGEKFAVLRRAARATDHYHGDLARGMPEYDIDPASARVSAASSGGRTFRVVPGRRGVCLLQSRGGPEAGGSCTSIAAAQAGELVFTSEGGPTMPEGVVEVVGLVPDGVSEVELTFTGRARVAAPVRENVYAVRVDEVPDAVRWGGRVVPLR